MKAFTAAVVTISDTCTAGTAVDSSGPLLRQLLTDNLQATSVQYDLIPDDEAKIEATLVYLSDIRRVDLIITTGGTGFGPRDVTPEATKRCVQREAPQLALVMALYSLEKTKFAALSRAICGIRNNTTLIVNMPGSRKAVAECFAAIEPILPHALQHMHNDVGQIKTVHTAVQQQYQSPSSVAPATTKTSTPKPVHICPHKTGTGAADDRNSPFPMVPVDEALATIIATLQPQPPLAEQFSDLALPPFRASIKDGYAMLSAGGTGPKKVLGYIAAGDAICNEKLLPNECYKINTGAPMPTHADCVVQVEDTRVLETSPASGKELVVHINDNVKLRADLDVRPVGCDLQMGERLFAQHRFYPGPVTYRSMLASVGRVSQLPELCVGIISTGDELIAPGTVGAELPAGKIFDSNTTMLMELCRQFGFTQFKTCIAPDTRSGLHDAMATVTAECPVTICTGGVSMGDRDFVKDIMTELGFGIRFGRVNMKPGKPMTYAVDAKGRAVFGLPGNPVSAFATFHVFVLPALRHVCNYAADKLSLPVVSVTLINDELELDPRPEYARATITSRDGSLFAEITGDQISSRLKSIDGADVLLHLPARSVGRTHLAKGTVLRASVLKHHFISKYE